MPTDSVRWFCAIVGLLVAVLTPEGTLAGNCSIPVSHASLQAAVNDDNCTTIMLAAGTFAGAVTVSRSLELIGAGSEATTLTGAAGVPTLTVSSPAEVHLQGLRLRSSSGSQNVINKTIGANLTMSDVAVGIAGSFGLPFSDGFEGVTAGAKRPPSGS